MVILKKSKRMRKVKTDRDPDLEVSGHGYRSGGSQEHTGQVRSQVMCKKSFSWPLGILPSGRLLHASAGKVG